MKSRLATLLLAALFAALGLAAGPTTGLAIARPQAGIVWVDESRPARQQACEVAPAPAFSADASPVLVPEAAEFDPASMALDRALFQRPPPFFLSNGR